MRQLLGPLALPCVLAVFAALLTRLMFWDLLEGVPPGMRLGFDVLTFGLLGLAALAAALGDLPQHLSNRYLWIAFGLGFPVIFLTDHDHGALELQRVWDTPLADFRATGGMTAEPAIYISRRGDGHYYIDAHIAEESIEFLIDTGATGVALTMMDAERIGLRTQALDFSVPVSTAAGLDFGAAAVIPELTLHGHRFQNVRVLVMRAGGRSLLGMSVLDNFSSIEIRNDQLLLRR